jgi:hypothetical protein
MLEIMSDPAKYAGDRRKDPLLQPVAMSLPNLQLFIEDHATGDGHGWNPPHKKPTGESVDNVYHDTNSPYGPKLIWGELLRGARESALLLWRWELQKSTNAGYDVGDEFMQDFLKKLSPHQRNEWGIF